jgi:hypothetical protein
LERRFELLNRELRSIFAMEGKHVLLEAHCNQYVMFEVLMVGSCKIAVAWEVAVSSPIDSYRSAALHGITSDHVELVISTHMFIKFLCEFWQDTVCTYKWSRVVMCCYSCYFPILLVLLLLLLLLPLPPPPPPLVISYHYCHKEQRSWCGGHTFYVHAVHSLFKSSVLHILIN